MNARAVWHRNVLSWLHSLLPPGCHVLTTPNLCGTIVGWYYHPTRPFWIFPGQYVEGRVWHTRSQYLPPGGSIRATPRSINKPMGTDGKCWEMDIQPLVYHPQPPGTSTALAWPLSGTLPAASWMTRPKSLTLAPFLGSQVWGSQHGSNMVRDKNDGFAVFWGERVPLCG